MFRHGFKQLVSKPTTDHGALLDYVYFNGSIEGVFVDVVDCFYSDHDTVYVPYQLMPVLNQLIVYNPMMII